LPERRPVKKRKRGKVFSRKNEEATIELELSAAHDSIIRTTHSERKGSREGCMVSENQKKKGVKGGKRPKIDNKIDQCRREKLP